MAIRRTKRGFILTDEHAHDYVRMVAEDGNEQPAPETSAGYWMDRLWEIHKIATQSRVLPEDVDRIAQLSIGFAPAPAQPASSP